MAITVDEKKPLAAGTGLPNADSVSPGKLAAALAALIEGAPAVSQSGNDYTIQLKDAKGVNIAAKWLARIWWSDVAAGAVSTATITNAAVSGVRLRVITGTGAANCRDMEWVSTSGGVAKFTATGSGTKWLNVTCQGNVYSAQFTLGS